MVLFEMCDYADLRGSDVVVEKYAVMDTVLPSLETKPATLPRANEEFGALELDHIVSPIEITVLQLLPDFDGTFADITSENGMQDDIVSYTSEELFDLQKDIIMDEENAELTEEFLQEPCLLPALGISPAVVQRIRSDSLGKSDFLKKKKEDDDTDTDSLWESCVPTLLGRRSPRLSLSLDGFIVLRDYKISPDTLGGGKLSEVRLAYCEKDRTQYAVKIHSKMKLQNYNLLLRTSRNPLEEVYREIDILKKLDHPNIIRLIEVVDEADDDNIYMVFERLDHELMNIPSDTPFGESEARKYFKDILFGVECMHQQNIVHRDLKPENMLVSRDGQIKIADFGFCEYLCPDPNGSDEMMALCISGTPAFTPPECLNNQKTLVPGRGLDMWSLGVTLYALLTGSVPFKGETMVLLHDTIKTSAVEFPPGLHLSESVKDLICNLLNKSPLKRYRMDDVKRHPWLDENTSRPVKLLLSVGSFNESVDEV
ncbi:calcium/calmodulin-dependent protein kinase kinase 2-like [Paramacrobiotus metropolitanus]|uniref:calcium/calmodulin-dependent protein kinase kinase 2-like n=1 Tax=Paramacrobiotus metropolitanus TaxID=2943436 RepID=UPI002445D2CC|nr:calcium/calmodulin-dependent protein kinase kinase 2-like [Paramacrobiotus metropolitanus]